MRASAFLCRHTGLKVAPPFRAASSPLLWRLRRSYSTPQDSVDLGGALVKRVGQSLEEYRDEIAGSALLLSISGGLDSIACAKILIRLNELEPAWQFGLHVIHFNHGLRPESIEEAQFVADFAREHQLPFHLCEASPEQVTRWSQKSGGMQESARDWRRAESGRVLQGLSSVSGQRYVVTGHHRDDNVETLLMKLLRGVHLSRIQGMLTLSPPNEHGARVFRPLLTAAVKDDLRLFCESTQQPWREDASNLSTKYKRNEVRLELVPLMAKLAGGSDVLEQRLSSLASQSGSLRSFLEEEATAWEASYCSNTEEWLPLEPWIEMGQGPVRTEVLHRFLSKHSTLSVAHMSRVEARLLDQSDREWVVHLPGGASVERAGAFLNVGPVVSKTTPSPVYTMHASKELLVQSTEDVLNLLKQQRYTFECQEGESATGQIVVSLREDEQRRFELRFVKPGDYLETSSEHGSNRKVAVLLREAQVLLHRRRNALVLVPEGTKAAIALWLPSDSGWKLETGGVLLKPGRVVTIALLSSL